MNELYQIRFNKDISNEHIEQRLFLSALNTENVFGEAAMRLDASFKFDRKSRICLIDRGTEVGRHIARLFIAYISKEFGEDCYSVERIEAGSAVTVTGRK